MESFTTGQLFVELYGCSTFSACLVTLWTLSREFGWRTALKMATQQSASSLVTALLVSNELERSASSVL